MILIVTNKQDITVDFVVERLSSRKIRFHRFNTEDYPGRYSITASHSGDQIDTFLSTENANFPLSEINAAWFRRPGTPVIHGMIGDDGHREFALREALAMLEGIYRLLSDKWLNDPGAIHLAESKIYQLHLASTIGFSVPRTVISSDFVRLRDFIVRQDERTVIKPLATATFTENGTDYVVFTSRISLSDIDDHASVQCAPFIVQQLVEKQFDLRITVVGEKIFPAEIHSQLFEETSIDWRKGQRVDLTYAQHSLPQDIQEKCIKIVRRLGLRFGAIDMILDKAGKYWFLEINPNGQWAWLEQRLQFDITGAIVDELTRIGCHRVESH